jgi:Flp pilus assembly protein TadB
MPRLADDTPDTGGQAVSRFDLLIFGTALLGGLILVFRFLRGALRADLHKRLLAAVDRAHARATSALIARGILRFPGAGLVAPSKAWAAGESVFIFLFVLAMFFDPTPRTAAAAFLPSLSLGAAAVVLCLRDQGRKRLHEIRTALPTASFLLSLMLEAGMASQAAMPEVLRALPRGPLVSELTEIAQSRAFGVSRDEGIERSRNRVPLDDYRLFLNLLQQGERLGIGFSQALRELSSKMLESQGHRAEALAQKAAVKLLFPLVVFIFPSVFLVILSPVVLNLLELLER